MKSESSAAGHIYAGLTIFIWGTTFISTKILLRSFSPIEILFVRFLLGFIALSLLYPRRLKINDRRQELLFIGAGACGITLYYLLENIALNMTTASNVGIIMAITPFFTALLGLRFLKAEKPGPQFYIGFLAAISGVAIISFRGDSPVELNPAGDSLAVLAAMTWSVYSILTRKISELGHNAIQTTRRTFFYGLMFMLPLLHFLDFRLEPARYASAVNLGNIIFLGLGASALCFVTWSLAVRLLGAVKTSVYIYMVPVVTVATSVIVLNEPLTPLLVFGASLTLAGLWLSETKIFRARRFSSRLSPTGRL